LTRWNASIFGPDGVGPPDQTVFENRFYQLLIECGNDYPLGPPKIKFFDKANLPFVGPSGEVRWINSGGVLEARGDEDLEQRDQNTQHPRSHQKRNGREQEAAAACGR